VAPRGVPPACSHQRVERDQAKGSHLHQRSAIMRIMSQGGQIHKPTPRQQTCQTSIEFKPVQGFELEHN